MDNLYDPLIVAIQDLEERGYVNNLIFVKGSLYNPDSGESYGPEEIKITEYHSFAGQSEYEHGAMLYAIDAPDGTKGLVVDAENELGSFVQMTQSS